MDKHGEIIVYQSKDGETAIEVQLEKDTVWLTQTQMVDLFQRDQSVISRHLNNVFKEKELDKKSNMQKMHIAFSDKPVAFYNLDVIISVGYRVKSFRGTQFRIWATNILKQHLIKGYTVNDKRLGELRKAIRLVENVLDKQSVSQDETKALIAVVSDYAYALDVLGDYDYQRIESKKLTRRKAQPISYKEAKEIIAKLKDKFSESAQFGIEKDKSLQSSLNAVFQAFDGKDVYPGIEEKAAHLLYFLVKNHSFVDGNKRIAAALFLWFMDKNRLLYSSDGLKRIADNALVAMTLMTAESNPKEKDIICKVIVNLINKNIK